MTVALVDDSGELSRWRTTARQLLVQGIAPHAVHWHVTPRFAPRAAPKEGEEGISGYGSTGSAVDANLDLFAGTYADEAAVSVQPAVTECDTQASPPAENHPFSVPTRFMQMAQLVLLHQSEQRWHLLYRLLWRLQHEPSLRHDLLDPDWVLMRRWAKAVQRDMHKMKAFVRFRPVDTSNPDAPWDGQGPLHVAWFEPEHRIVQAVAQMRWSILTPQCSLRWYPAAASPQALIDAGEPCAAGLCIQPAAPRPGVLWIAPGARKQDAPAADAGESLWLTYYASIFNPNRLKTQAMVREMPQRYWKNLPEAVLIDPLIHTARQRSAQMLNPGSTQKN
jgi:probable DNA metabolism protein